MFDDPIALTSDHWNNIHVWLQWLWIYLPLVVTFAFTLLVAHALIPSLISTRHLPASANRLRLPLTGFAVGFLIAAVVVLAFAMNATLDVEQFWDRYLI